MCNRRRVPTWLVHEIICSQLTCSTRCRDSSTLIASCTFIAQKENVGSAIEVIEHVEWLYLYRFDWIQCMSWVIFLVAKWFPDCSTIKGKCDAYYVLGVQTEMGISASSDCTCARTSCLGRELFFVIMGLLNLASSDHGSSFAFLCQNGYCRSPNGQKWHIYEADTHVPDMIGPRIWVSLFIPIPLST